MCGLSGVGKGRENWLIFVGIQPDVCLSGNLVRSQQHIMVVCHPVVVEAPATCCQSHQLVNLPQSNRCMSIIRAQYVGVLPAIAHELGHSLWLEHGFKNNQEYTDYTSAMGFGCCAPT